MIRRFWRLALVGSICWCSGTGSLTTAQSRPPRPELVLQTGHTHPIETMVISRDGRIMASADGEYGDGTVKLWDVATGRQVRTLSGLTDQVRTLAFSPDDRLIAAGRTDETIRVWDVRSGRELHRFYVARPAAGRLVFGGDRYLVSLPGNNGKEPDPELEKCPRVLNKPGFCESRDISVWDLQRGRFVYAVTPPSGDLRVDSDWDAAVSPDGRILLVGAEGKPVGVHELATGRPATSFAGALAPFAFDSTGRTMLAYEADGSVGLWDVQSRRRAATLATGAGARAQFTSDGRRIVTIKSARRVPSVITVWDVATRTAINSVTIDQQFDCANCVDRVSPDGSWIVRGGNGAPKLAIWSLDHPERPPLRWQELREPIVFSAATGRVYARFPGHIWSADPLTGAESCFGAPAPRAVRSVAVTAAAASRASSWVSTSDGGGVALWPALSGVPSKIQPEVVQKTPSLTFMVAGASPSLTEIGPNSIFNPPTDDWRQPACILPGARAGADGGQGEIWDATSLHALGFGSALPVAIAPTANWFATGADGQPWIQVSDWRSGAHVQTLDDRPAGAGRESAVVTALAANAAGTELASSTTAQPIVSLRDMRTRLRTRVLRGHTDRVTALAYDPMTGTLASTGWDRTVRLWSPASETPRATWVIDGAGTALAFRPDGQRLAVVVDGRLRELDLAGRERRRISTHVGAFAYSPDGRMLLTAGGEGTSNLWATDDGQLLATLVSFGDSGDWLVATPGGLFDGSPAAWRQMLWRFNNDTSDVVPVEMFFNDFYRPGLLADILAGKRPAAPTDIANLDRRQPTVTIEVIARETVGAAPRTATIRVDLQEASADPQHATGSGIRDVRLFRNGSLVRVWRGTTTLDARGRATLIADGLALVGGRNRFTAYAFNRANIRSTDATAPPVIEAARRGRGTAWILAIGINTYANSDFNLNYAVADAERMAEELEVQQRAIGRYERIETIRLTNASATKSNLLQALERLRERVQPEDAVFMFFAGHGTTNGPRFYLMPHDFGYTGSRDALTAAGVNVLLARSVSDQELARALEGIDAGQMVLMIDACRSGQALHADDPRQGPMNSPGLAQLAYEKGMYILAAAQGYQAALEAQRLGHGFLTYALLEDGLKNGAADRSPRDGTILIREWLTFAAERVPKLQSELLTQPRAVKLVFVPGQERLTPAMRSLQQPRVFFRREPDVQPLVIASGRR